MTSPRPGADIWLITGLPGAGKTTVARLLAGRMERGAHVEGDRLQHFIVSGNAWREQTPKEEEERQLALNVRNQCMLARSFSENGFVPVVDFLVARRVHLGEYQRQIVGLDLHFIVLAPRQEVIEQRDRARAAVHGHTHEDSLSLADVMAEELRDTGLWLDTSLLTAEQTVDDILSRQPEARV